MKKTKKINPEDIKIFWVRIGGFFGGHTEIETGYKSNKFFAEKKGIHFTSVEFFPPFTEKKFLNFRRFLVNNLKIFDWKSRYYDNNIMDGEQWEVKITLKTGKKYEFFGSNEYPENFEKLRKKIKHYFEKGI
jgi:hypothetical protein